MLLSVHLSTWVSQWNVCAGIVACVMVVCREALSFSVVFNRGDRGTLAWYGLRETNSRASLQNGTNLGGNNETPQQSTQDHTGSHRITHQRLAKTTLGMNDIPRSCIAAHENQTTQY